MQRDVVKKALEMPISAEVLDDYGVEYKRDQDDPVAYGARCTWWDLKEHAGRLPSGLPVCPFCGGVLFETSWSDWMRSAEKFRDAAGGTFYGIDYVSFLRWLQGRPCGPVSAMPDRVDEYRAEMAAIAGEEGRARRAAARKLRPIPVAEKLARIDARNGRNKNTDTRRQRRRAAAQSRRRNR